MNESERRWYLEPRVALPIVTGLIVLAALIAPQRSDARGGDSRLTTYSRSAQGARLFHDLAERAGFDVARSANGRFPTVANATYAVLAPTIPLRSRDTHELLEHVRAGGGALVVLSSATIQLQDSLGLEETSGQPLLMDNIGDSSTCPTQRQQLYSLWFGGDAYLTGVTFNRENGVLTEKGPDGIVIPINTFVQIRTSAGRGRRAAGRAPAMIGIPYGAGKIVVASDPDILRNDALRECRLNLDVAAVRAIEYLRDGNNPRSSRRNRIIFDEFHQGAGANAGSVRAISYFLGNTSSGHMVLQFAAAGLVLLAAAAPRMLPPREDRLLERRTLDEHVEALARAYEQVDASQTATKRLVQGLRRRTGTGSSSFSAHLSDEQFVEDIRTRYPTLYDYCMLLVRALAGRSTPRELPDIANAVAEIEEKLRQKT